MLPAERTFDRSLQRILGISVSSRCDFLPDPVQRIAYDDAALKEHPRGHASPVAHMAYWLLHRSRRWLPFRHAAVLVERAAHFARVRQRTEPADLLKIARQIRDLEHRLALADCYPRALVTAYLCLRAGRGCTLTIGVLAPTRKMHAWCSTQGLLPYEPLPEHYLYQPLWSRALTP